MKPSALTFLLQAAPASNLDATWIGWITSHILHPLILFTILVGIATFLGKLLMEASQNKTSTPDVRALAAAILPPLVGIWTLMYRGDLLVAIVCPDASGIAATLGIGFVSSFAFGRGSPISGRFNRWRIISATFFAATLFSIFVLSYAASHDRAVFRLYYALAVGWLIHLMLFGMPRVCYRFRPAEHRVFEIRPGPAEQYGLYLDGVLQKIYSKPSDAALDLKEHQVEIEKQIGDGKKWPDDIMDWDLVYRWHIRFSSSRQHAKKSA